MEKLNTIDINITEYMKNFMNLFTEGIVMTLKKDEDKNKIKKEVKKISSLLEDKIKNKRWCAKKFYLKIYNIIDEKEDILNYYKEKYSICKIAVSEYNKDEKRNINIYLEFVAKKDIKNNEYLNYKNHKVYVETIGKRKKENLYNELLKLDEKCIYYGFDIKQDRYGKLTNKEIWYKYITNEWNIINIIEYDPSYLNKNLKKMVEKVENNLEWLKEKYNYSL